LHIKFQHYFLAHFTSSFAFSLMDDDRAVLIVPSAQAKLVKTHLELHSLLHKTWKLQSFEPGVIAIPTVFPLGEDHDESHITILKEINLPSEVAVIRVSRSSTLMPDNAPRQQNILIRCLELWLSGLDPPRSDMFANLTLALPRYDVYPPMLLFPPTAFMQSPWPSLFESLPARSVQMFFNIIAGEHDVTHVARNAPIPQVLDPSLAGRENRNVMRSPAHITPLRGHFGAVPPIPNPDWQDLAEAFWVHTRQNGIEQHWAPLHTMFSRGNVSEKARVLSFAKEESDEWSAVDMYAGIGYFTFSYVKGGASKVLAFEINPWSTAGLRKGAQKNSWHTVRFTKSNAENEWRDLKISNEKIAVFEMSNEHASVIVPHLRSQMPPIKHVNCGLLPSSRASWDAAIQVIDPTGGCLHVHENFRIEEIKQKAVEVLQEIQILAGDKKAELRHIERVKSFAPGIIHCVLDIYLLPA
jgi:tRNA wybutosine-synthesizing protein 2